MPTVTEVVSVIESPNTSIVISDGILSIKLLGNISIKT